MSKIARLDDYRGEEVWEDNYWDVLLVRDLGKINLKDFRSLSQIQEYFGDEKEYVAEWFKKKDILTDDGNGGYAFVHESMEIKYGFLNEMEIYDFKTGRGIKLREPHLSKEIVELYIRYHLKNR